MIKFEYTQGDGLSFGRLNSKPHCYIKYGGSKVFGFRKEDGSKSIFNFLEDVFTRKQWHEMQAENDYTKHGKKRYHMMYKKAQEILGCKPSTALRMWNALEYKHKIVPRHDLVMLLGFSRGGINSNKVEKIIKNEKLLRETLNDGIKNVLPFVHVSKRSPKEIKAVLGKGLWKKLTKNSYSRNKLIAELSESWWFNGSVSGYKESDLNTNFSQEQKDEIKNVIIKFNNLPSTILTKRQIAFELLCNNDYFFKIYKEVTKTTHLKDVKFNPIRSLERLYIDAEIMAERCGIELNLNKISIHDIQAKHDELVSAVNEMEYSKDKFKWVNDLPCKYLKFGDYEVVLLDNRYDIQQEGINMHHCVGGYAGDCAGGKYLVYSVRKNGKRVSTLGLFKDGYIQVAIQPELATDLIYENVEKLNIKAFDIKNVPCWKFSQHYGAGNGRGDFPKGIASGIADMAQVFLADQVLLRLNYDKRALQEEDLIYHEIIYTSFPEAISENRYNNSFDKLVFNPYKPFLYESLYDYNFK